MNLHALIVLVTLVAGLDIYIEVCAYDIACNKECRGFDQPSPPGEIDPGLYLFKDITLPNNYIGYIGKYFIWAVP